MNVNLGSESSDNPVAQGVPDSDFFNVDLSDYKIAQPRIQKIVDDWDKIKLEMERFRALRYMRVDEEWLKAEGKFDEDQKYIATRLIDTNIRAEQPQYLAYITQSARQAIFEPIGEQQPPANLVANGEKLYTLVARYLGWQKPRIRVVDGACTHGWDFVEILFNEQNPGNFEVDHVGHANLCFCTDAEDINNQEIILRRVNFTAIQLKQNVRQFGFNPTTVKQLIETNQNSEAATKDVQYTCFKYFYRTPDGTIMVGWYGSKCNDWLKAPEPHFLGRRDVAAEMINEVIDGQTIQDYPKLKETEFPFYGLAYVESEDPRIIELKGRGYLDEPAQEAASALLSTFVNGCMRASQPYASTSPSPVPGEIDSAPPKQLAGVTLKQGMVYNKPLTFFSLPYPGAEVIQGFQTVTTSNKAETAKIDAAVENRKDSRKTATEISATQADAAKLTGVQVTLLSIFSQQVENRCWEIFSNRVLQNKIAVPADVKPFFAFKYIVRPSGDVDVIQRQAKIALQMQAWPVIQNTPFAQMFLEDILRAMFPDEADKYISQLKQTDPRQLVMALATVVQGLTTDPKTGQLDPHYAQHGQQLQNLANQVQAYLSQSMAQPLQKTAAHAASKQPAMLGPATQSQGSATQDATQTLTNQ